MRTRAEVGLMRAKKAIILDGLIHFSVIFGHKTTCASNGGGSGIQTDTPPLRQINPSGKISLFPKGETPL
jgi:hypothetical protein